MIDYSRPITKFASREIIVSLPRHLENNITQIGEVIGPPLGFPLFHWPSNAFIAHRIRTGINYQIHLLGLKFFCSYFFWTSDWY